MTIRIGIIGAGISGIAAARQLQGYADISVFEKSRGPGGRMATRRAGNFQFDHGAQFFTARSDEFQRLLTSVGEDLAIPWQARVLTLERGKKPFKREWFEAHYVARPQMNSLVKALAADQVITTETRVNKLEETPDGWRLHDVEGSDLGTFDWVISSAPAPQTAELMPAEFSDRESLQGIHFSPCYALMLGFEVAPALNFDAALVRDEALDWIAANSGKPGRGSGFSLLLHSNNHWAEKHREDDPDSIAEAMTMSLGELTGVDVDAASHSVLHRWLHARAETDLETDFLLDADNQLAVCGDWCRGNRVEDAFLSGHRLGKKLRAVIAG